MQRWSKVGLMCLLMIWVIGTEPLQGEINDGTMSGATSKTFSGEKVSLEPMLDELRTVLQKAGVVDLMETAKTSEDWKKVVEVMKTLTDQVKQKESLFYLYMLIFKSGIKATAGVEPVDWDNLLSYGIQAKTIGSELDPLPQKAYGSLLLDIQAAEIKAGRYQDALALGNKSSSVTNPWKIGISLLSLPSPRWGKWSQRISDLRRKIPPISNIWKNSKKQTETRP